MSSSAPSAASAARFPEHTYTAFAGFHRIASGPREQVVARLRELSAADGTPPLVFDDRTGERLDLDLRDPVPADCGPAPAEEQQAAARAVGRPRLGVVAREVTLLPRHWEWLGRQPGGASVALRRLVDEARHVHADRDLQRAAREAAYRFMTAIAGDLPGFEEATRALFAGERPRFEQLVEPWPEDLRGHLQRLAADAWSAA
ncbi:DUF2239 family protein [Variovorax sp. J22P168]|uniref:DUF2239 family protein n=1 Tax=Variovorax jilinensis TaxID=3053513 RepID=UPI002577B6B1|nr:DUF2239 family protein [Variovorax sp. J22P168]MDM0013273.1 DUF2239 family protein [Variovorax sp. J22P168]